MQKLHINPADPLDLSFWALVLDVSEADVLGAIEKVGDNYVDVSHYLRFPALSPRHLALCGESAPSETNPDHTCFSVPPERLALSPD